MIIAEAKKNILEWAENEFNLVTSSTDELIKDFWYWFDEEEDSHYELEKLLGSFGVEVFYSDEYSIVHTKGDKFKAMVQKHNDIVDANTYDCGGID